MQVVDLNESYEKFEDMTNRSRGDGIVHLTRIIRALDSADYTGVKWNMDTTGDCGFIWERALEMAYKDMLGVRPGEVELDGIIGSPDGIADDPLGKLDMVDEEYKLTWRSSRRPIEDNWYYMTQFMGYCKMLGTTVTVAKVLYIAGDYRGSGPQYKVYRIEYEQRELDRNWNYLLAHARNEGWIEGGEEDE
jgi:hypothetical protein